MEIVDDTVPSIHVIFDRIQTALTLDRVRCECFLVSWKQQYTLYSNYNSTLTSLYDLYIYLYRSFFRKLPKVYSHH